jgi:hypothetical protein
MKIKPGSKVYFLRMWNNQVCIDSSTIRYIEEYPSKTVYHLDTGRFSVEDLFKTKKEAFEGLLKHVENIRSSLDG